MNISIKKQLNLNFEDAINKITDELSKQGFGIITTIDIKEVIKKKLDKDFKKFTILGACNPEFAHRAIEFNEDISVLLPCNVVIQEKEQGVEVIAFNPDIINFLIDDQNLKNLSVILKQKIEEVFRNL